MQLGRLITILICSTLFSSFLIISSAVAEDTIDNLVNATFEIEFISGSELNIEIEISPQILTTDKTFTIEEIKKTLLIMRRLLKENPDAIVYKLQLFTSFPGTELFYQAARLGMKFPESLEGWADFHYDKIQYNRFNARQKRFLEERYRST